MKRVKANKLWGVDSSLFDVISSWSTYVTMLEVLVDRHEASLHPETVAMLRELAACRSFGEHYDRLELRLLASTGSPRIDPSLTEEVLAQRVEQRVNSALAWLRAEEEKERDGRR